MGYFYVPKTRLKYMTFYTVEQQFDVEIFLKVVKLCFKHMLQCDDLILYLKARFRSELLFDRTNSEGSLLLGYMPKADVK